MTATTKKTLFISAIVAAIVLFFYRKRAKAKNAVQNAIDDILNGSDGETFDSLPDGVESNLIYGLGSDFDLETFFFLTPAGNFTITQPDTSSRAYNSLHNGNGFKLGWQAPTNGVIVVTYLPLVENPLVENIILDLNERTTRFEYVQL